MKISRSVSYALVAVGFVAEHQQDSLVLAVRVAKEYGIPLEYLLKIMQQLVKAGVLKSKRGPRGGFSLARAAKDTTMLSIIEAINGPTKRGMGTMELTHEAEFSIKMEAVCKAASEKEIEIYEKTTLADMLAE